jgi:hypothetical protein
MYDPEADIFIESAGRSYVGRGRELRIPSLNTLATLDRYFNKNTRVSTRMYSTRCLATLHILTTYPPRPHIPPSTAVI